MAKVKVYPLRHLLMVPRAFASEHKLKPGNEVTIEIDGKKEIYAIFPIFSKEYLSVSSPQFKKGKKAKITRKNKLVANIDVWYNPPLGKIFSILDTDANCVVRPPVAKKLGLNEGDSIEFKVKGSVLIGYQIKLDWFKNEKYGAALKEIFSEEGIYVPPDIWSKWFKRFGLKPGDEVKSNIGLPIKAKAAPGEGPAALKDESLYVQGNTALDAGKYGDAVQFFTKAIKEGQKVGWSYLWMSRAYLGLAHNARFGGNESATDEFVVFAEKSANMAREALGEDAAPVYFLLTSAKISAWLGMYKNAEALLKSALKKGKLKSPQFDFDVAECYWLMGKPKTAKKYLKIALELNKDYKEAVIFAEQLANAPEAILRAEAFCPDCGDRLVSADVKCPVCDLKKRVDEVLKGVNVKKMPGAMVPVMRLITDFNKTYNFSKNPVACLAIAQIYFKLNSFGGAKFWCEKGLALDPNNQELKNLLEEIKRFI